MGNRYNDKDVPKLKFYPENYYYYYYYYYYLLYN